MTGETSIVSKPQVEGDCCKLHIARLAVTYTFSTSIS